MAAKVFISYRREDSAAYAGRIQDRLERELGRDLLFIDVDGIPLGINFVKVLREEVAKCGVLLAVIGPHWLDLRDEDGTRRLDNPTDFVRVEIATALQREIPVIPIVLDNTRVPKADHLPKDLKELALRNGLSIRHASFHTDMDKLIQALKGQISAAQQTMPDATPLSASVAAPETSPKQTELKKSEGEETAWLTIKGVTGFGFGFGLGGVGVRVTATVNGIVYIYPTLAGVDWLEIGPEMAAQSYQIPVRDNYTVRFTAETRGGLPLSSVEEQHISGKTNGIKTYGLREVDRGQRAAPASAEVRYTITIGSP